MDKDFVDCMISTPIAEIPQERLNRIQKWLIIVFKKIEYGLCKGLDDAGVSHKLTHSQLQVIVSSIWNAVFRVPVIEIIQEEQIYQDLINKKIRPMTCDDIFNSKELNMRDN